ncbi:MAG TPA: uroporphyrinogen decarboxylase [Anaerolineae bacterium]
MSDRFLRACRREPVDCTPVWLMRQAGRYMPEYRRIREKHSMLEMVRTPELAAEITLQPINAFALDAAIIFADILPPLIGTGIDLEYAAGEGPVIHNPVRTAADVAALRVPSPEENVPFTLAAIRLVCAELAGKVPLIGFSGAPFTLASYLVEGGSSRDLKRTKSLMHRDPAAWQMLMEKLAQLSGEYLAAQVRAGAQAVQLFDSWAGALGPADYRDYVLPYSRRAIAVAQAAGAPVIHFSTDTGGMLETVRAAGGDVIGIDWRVDLAAAWERLGRDVAVQGNLDPVALLAPPSVLKQRAGEVLAQAAGRPGHIFNLGHGVLLETPVEQVRDLVDFVHEWRNSGS